MMQSPMRPDATFVPDRFGSTVAYYTAHRPRFPLSLLRGLIARVGVGATDRVLDLGCGPGFPAVDLARLGAGRVLGMDPDPAMLAAARAEAARANVDMEFMQGSSYDLSPDIGPFRMVTMARCFHWMARSETLQALDAMVEPSGAVVILSDSPEPGPENRWQRIMRNVQDEHVGPVPSGPTNHAAVVLDSSFAQLEVYGVIERYRLTVEDIIGRAFSLLKSSPDALGSRMDDFADDLRDRLLRLSPDGQFTEVRRSEALIARRPS